MGSAAGACCHDREDEKKKDADTDPVYNAQVQCLKSNPHLVSADDERYWRAYIGKEKEIGALLDAWGSEQRQFLTLHFIKFEATRRSGNTPRGGTWPVGYISLDDLRQLLKMFFVAQKLPEPDLSNLAWHTTLMHLQSLLGKTRRIVDSETAVCVVKLFTEDLAERLRIKEMDLSNQFRDQFDAGQKLFLPLGALAAECDSKGQTDVIRQEETKSTNADDQTTADFNEVVTDDMVSTSSINNPEPGANPEPGEAGTNPEPGDNPEPECTTPQRLRFSSRLRRN